MLARLLLAVLPTLAAGPALAGDVPLPAITPEGAYLVMTQDDATSTSECIGDPRTPMCAVETVLACFVRGDHELCRTAMGLGHDPGLGGEGPSDSTIYKVIRAEVLTEDSLPWRPSHDLPWRPGDVSMQAGDIRIDIVDRDCAEEIAPQACSPALFEIAYIVRKIGARWVVMTWRPPYETRMNAEQPEILWRDGQGW